MESLRDVMRPYAPLHRSDARTLCSHGCCYHRYFLRRTKADLTQKLPIKEEVIVQVELTQLQKKVYRAILERNFELLSGAGRSAMSKNSLVNVGMQLRKTCCHPFLLDGIEADEFKDLKTYVCPYCMAGWSGRMCVYGHHCAILRTDDQMERLVACSGKHVLLDKLLPKLKAEGMSQGPCFASLTTLSHRARWWFHRQPCSNLFAIRALP